MTNQLINTQITMTSLEIVDFINTHRQENGNTTTLRHDHFMTKVPQVLGSEVAPKYLGSSFYQGNGSAELERSIYNFPKREACLMAMSYSYELQAQIFDRMTELEQQLLLANRPSYMIEDPVERAKKWIEETTAQREERAALAYTVVQQQQTIKLQTPKAEVYDIIANKDYSYTIRDTAKILKMRPIDLTTWLLENGWMYGSKASSYRPRAAHADVHIKLVVNSYGTQVRVTSKGLVLLAKKMNKTIDNT